MRLTQVVYGQHIGRMFKKHWKVQGQRVIINTDAEKILKEKGIPVYEYEEIIKDIPELESKIVECTEDVPVDDERLHPLWNPRPCYLYKNHSSLLEGIDQAKRLTNTVEIEEGLPSKLQSLVEKLDCDLNDNLVKRCIMSSHLFDASQEKLPKLHDPERPAWVFPRVYGVVDKRRNRLMCFNLVNFCQAASRTKNMKPRFALEDAQVSVPFVKDERLIQLECRADLILATKRPLEPHANADVVRGTVDIPLPDLYPLDPTVSLLKENLYELQDTFHGPLSVISFLCGSLVLIQTKYLFIEDHQLGKVTVLIFVATMEQLHKLINRPSISEPGIVSPMITIYEPDNDVMLTFNGSIKYTVGDPPAAALMPHVVDTSLHTVFFHYNETEVKNLYDLPVTEQQFLGRSLVHTFAVAAAQARHTFGNEVSGLEHPVTLQSIHTDGKRFHFSVYQLNTLDLNGTDGIKNILWHTPVSNIFEECSYKDGRPELIGYNEDVAKNTLAFYVNS